MRILVLSDSHRSEITLDFKNYDCVIHCGDRGFSHFDNSIYYVKGNCDLTGEKEIETKIWNKKVFITHGDKYGVKYSYDRLVYKALELNTNVVFFGHTHYPDLFIDNDILFINPGAYEDDRYVVIDDNNITFYHGDIIYKKIDYKW